MINKIYQEAYDKFMVELKEMIKTNPSLFTEKEIRVIDMRHGFTDGITYTLEEVGKEFGVTRERIRQIEAKGHEKVRQYQKEINFKKHD